MTERLQGARVLIYSHDSFGLGHLRRCRAVAHSLVDAYKGLSVLILSGSPIIGSFDFRARVDFVRVPGVVKLRNGEYTSLGLHIDLHQTLAMRASIIRHTAETFAPDLFLVDKEPLGLKREVAETLELMKSRGTYNVLGLRDIMDDATTLCDEWQRKQVMPALESLYDEIWIYGIERMGDPLAAVHAPASVRGRSVFTGYLPRTAPQDHTVRTHLDVDDPFILVTAGGGGDGRLLVDWVLRAFEAAPNLGFAAVVALGPFMPAQDQEAFERRAAKLAGVQMITFDNHLELLMQRAIGVVGMGGYNTFCEILSFDKPALIVPRTTPRREQLIRAERAAGLGLVRMLDVESARATGDMVDALRQLPFQHRPSSAAIPGLLEGLNTINRRVRPWLAHGETGPASAVLTA